MFSLKYIAIYFQFEHIFHHQYDEKYNMEHII